MSYNKQNFTDGLTLKASHLINLENAIIDNEKRIDALSGNSDIQEFTSNILIYKTSYLCNADGEIVKEILTVDKNHPFNHDTNQKYSFTTTDECKYLPYYSYEDSGKRTSRNQDASVYNDYMVGGDGYGYITLQKFSTNELLGEWLSDKYDVLGGDRGQPHNNAVTCVTPRTPVNITYTQGGKTLVSTTGLEATGDKYTHITFVDGITYSSDMNLCISPDYLYIVFCYDENDVYLGTNGDKVENLSSATWYSGGWNINLSHLVSLHPTIKTIKIIYKSSSSAAGDGSAATPKDARFAISKVTGDGLPRYYSNCYSDRTYNKGTLCVYDFSLVNETYSHKLTQLIKVDFVEDELWTSTGGSDNDDRPYGNFIVDIEHGWLYCLAMKTADSLTRIFKFNLPFLTDGVYDSSFDCNIVTLTKDDIIEYFDIGYCYSIQGCTYYQNQLFITEGFNVDSGRNEMPRIRIVDPILKKQVLRADFYAKSIYT